MARKSNKEIETIENKETIETIENKNNLYLALTSFKYRKKNLFRKYYLFF